MGHKLVLSLLVLSLLLTACGAVATPQANVDVVVKTVSVKGGGSYTDIDAADLQMMLPNKDFTLVNVHIPFVGNIPGTDLSIPFDQLAQNLDKLPDKNAKIVLYCRSGMMSAMAAETLVNLDYTDILNLSGGMSAWEQAGLQIEH